MKKMKQTPFYVIVDNINSNNFEKYDVMPYFVNCYKQKKGKKDCPKTYEEFKEFVVSNSMYMFWSRTEWEIVLHPWCSGTKAKKIDVHYQIMNNIDLVVELLMRNVGVQI